MATVPVVPVVPFPSIDHALDLCARHARYVGEGAAILRAGLGRLDALDSEINRLNELERQADQLIEQVVTLVPRVVTLPSERAAIVTLTHGLDDVLDDLDAGLTRMLLLRLQGPSPLAAALVGVLIRQLEAIERALGLLRVRRERAAIQMHLTTARSLAAEADGLLVEALAGLRADALDLPQIVEWLKWTEVHRALGTAARHGRDAAQAVEALVARLA